MYTYFNLADCGQLWPKPTAVCITKSGNSGAQQGAWKDQPGSQNQLRPMWLRTSSCGSVQAKSNMTAVFAVLAALLLALAPTVSAVCAHRYERCGGIGYTGPVCCDGHSSCKVQNPYYSQCVPISGPPGSVPWYGQCGGQGYTGSKICEPDSTCVASGPYYSQCIPN
jgi:Fungal cellulose binding domain